jgi:putative flippase GtrA
MCDTLKKILSHDSGAFWQFVKYGVIGVMATLVQTGVFYLFAATCLKCLADGDMAVEFLGLPAVEISDSLRALRFTAATAVGFAVANLFCWLMNRRFVFRPGRFRWYVEFSMFFLTSGAATVVALAVSSAMICWLSLMTSAAVIIEVLVSFLVNFFARKFLIFRR